MPAKLAVAKSLYIPHKSAPLVISNAGTSKLEVDSMEIVDGTIVIDVNLRRFTLAPGKSIKRTVTHKGLGGGTCKIKIASNGGKATVVVTAPTGGGVPINPCFAGDTLVLLADGRTRAISELAIDDELATVDELAHLCAKPVVSPARVVHVLRHPGEELLSLGGIRVTAKHRWAVRDAVEPRFVTTEALTVAHEMLACSPIGWHAVPAIAPAGTIDEVWNLTTTARTYCVAATPAGPFYVVHNMKPSRKNPGKSPPTKTRP